MRLISLVFALFMHVTLASAASFTSADIKAFTKAMKAIESSDLFAEETRADDGFSLSSLNPFGGMGEMMGMMFGGGDGSEWDGMISPTGEFITLRVAAAGIAYAEEAQIDEMKAILTQAGFESIDAWAQTSDAIMGAMMASMLGPMIDQIPVRSGTSATKAVRAETTKLLKEEAMQLAKAELTKFAIKAALGAAGLDVGGLIKMGPSEQDLKASLKRVTGGVFAGVGRSMMGMSQASLERLSLVVATTPPEDIALLKANRKLLPKDMRDFDDVMDMD